MLHPITYVIKMNVMHLKCKCAQIYIITSTTAFECTQAIGIIIE